MNTLRTILTFAAIALYGALAATPHVVLHQFHACDASCESQEHAHDGGACHEHHGHCSHHHASHCCSEGPAKNESSSPSPAPHEHDDCQLCRILGQAAQPAAIVEVPACVGLVATLASPREARCPSRSLIIARGRAPPSQG